MSVVFVSKHLFLFQDILKCYVCDMETSAAHKYIHVLCGTSCEERLLCPNCKVDSNRVRHRSGAMDSHLKQANTMVARSKNELGTPAIGQTVAVPIPTFDRGKGDSRNLLGRIIEVFNLTIFFMIVIRL